MYDDTYYKFALDIRHMNVRSVLIKQPPPEPIEFDDIEQGEDQPPPEPIEFEDIEQEENQPSPEPVEFDDTTWKVILASTKLLATETRS
jgi:hypothetical protein